VFAVVVPAGTGVLRPEQQQPPGERGAARTRSDLPAQDAEATALRLDPDVPGAERHVELEAARAAADVVIPELVVADSEQLRPMPGSRHVHAHEVIGGWRGHQLDVDLP